MQPHHVNYRHKLEVFFFSIVPILVSDRTARRAWNRFYVLCTYEGWCSILTTISMPFHLWLFERFYSATCRSAIALYGCSVCGGRVKICAVWESCLERDTRLFSLNKRYVIHTFDIFTCKDLWLTLLVNILSFLCFLYKVKYL